MLEAREPVTICDQFNLFFLRKPEGEIRVLSPDRYREYPAKVAGECSRKNA